MDEQQVKKKKGRINEGADQIDDDDQKWVFDTSVDYKGKVHFRASTGVWRASVFVTAVEFIERLTYFGLATNLIQYLTKIIHQDLETAAKNVNYWAGVTAVMPLVGGFLADAYTGRFTMILFSFIVYLMGLSLLTMSQFIPSLKPCSTILCNQSSKIHKMVFFLALYLISIGIGGLKPCLQSFGADQFDDDHPEERKNKMSFFNWWNFALCCGLFLGVTLVVYIQDTVSWGVATLILTISMAITVVTFYMGRFCYRYRVPEGSTFTPIIQVFVAAMRKRNLPCPSDPALLYEILKPEKNQGRLLCHTNRLGFLNKAAIVDEKDKNTSVSNQKHNPWRLATVTKIEEVKLVLNTIPIWLTTLTFGIGVVQPSTFFVKQAATMDLKITNSFTIPPATISTAGAITMIITIVVYDRILIPFLRKSTGNERGINILRRIGIGMFFAILAMLVAALVEKKRLGIARNEIPPIGGIKTKPSFLSMSVFWLAPQFMLLGFSDGFTLVGLQEYFYDQVPDSMRSLGIAFYSSVIGVGSFLSSFLITVVNRITGKNGESWIGKDLTTSRLDNFYWLLAVMNGLNLCVYVLIAKRYSYKRVVDRKERVVGDGSVGKAVESIA
ncbi:hypothetical protein UlMin_024187 [Ulmus minor]